MRACDLTVEFAVGLYFERIQPRIVAIGNCHTIKVRHNGHGYKYIHCRPFGRIGIHVVASVVFDGPLADSRSVLHRCDHRWCCNPLHLFRGTQLDNIRDMDRKCRRGVWHPDGEVNPAAKLTRKEVQSIRDSSLSGIALAGEFGVSQQLISAIRRKEVWS